MVLWKRLEVALFPELADAFADLEQPVSLGKGLGLDLPESSNGNREWPIGYNRG